MLTLQTRRQGNGSWEENYVCKTGEEKIEKCHFLLMTVSLD